MIAGQSYKSLLLVAIVHGTASNHAPISAIVREFGDCEKDFVASSYSSACCNLRELAVVSPSREERESDNNLRDLCDDVRI